MYGRDADLRALHGFGAGLVLIAADSGVGKSEIIGGLDAGWTGTDIVAPAAVLASPQGSLQIAFADAVGECLRAFSAANPEKNKALWEGLVSLVDRAASATTREAGRILLARIYASIESKFGNAMAEETRAVVSELLRKDSESLDDRLQSLSTPDLASQLIAVASDVSAHTGRRLILRFDRCELLGEQDLALLGELANRSIDELLIFATYSTNAPDSPKQLAILETRGAQRFELSALGESAIFEWLASELVDESAWQRIATVSSGYPFFIKDAIRLANGGLPLDQLSDPNGFETVLRLSWAGLDSALQATAMKVAGFVDPPPDDFLATHLKIDALDWATASGKLLAAGVFVSRPDGSIWFHDRRRNYLWRDFMTATAREASADASITTLRSWLNAHGQIEPWVFSGLPSIIRSAASEVHPESYLGKLIALGVDEMRLLFSLVELVEPNGTLGQAADTRSIVSYAAARFGGPQDAIASLERLAAQGFVVSAANEHSSVTLMVIPDGLSYAAVISEIEHRLNERPFPQFASTTFDLILRPSLAAFKMASTSLGDGGLRSYRFAFESLLESEVPKQSLRNGVGLAVALIARGQTVSTTATFSSIEDRAVAEDRLRLYEQTRSPNEPAIAEVVALPGARVRYARYGAILKRVKLKGTSIASLEDVRSHVEARDKIREVVRHHLTADEASAYGWRDRQVTLVEDAGTTSGWTEVTIAGSTSPGTRSFCLEGSKVLISDPLLELKLRRDGFITAGQRITRVVARGGAPARELSHPFTDVVEQIKQLGRAYNDRLPRAVVEADEAVLAAAIGTELRLQREIADDLVRQYLIPQPTLDPSDASLLFVLLPQSTGVNSMNWSAASYLIDDHAQTVDVKILDVGAPRPSWQPTRADAEALGIGDVSRVSWAGVGYASSLLEDLLGYESGDMQLSIPEWVLLQLSSKRDATDS